MKLVLASNNAKKLKELDAILAPLGWELIPQRQLGVEECDEPHCTFVENALEKARHAARLTGLPALADDSGLCVDAFGGAPGVHSARYAQESPDEPKSDSRNNAKLLAELGERCDRQAHFVSVIVFVRHAEDPAADHRRRRMARRNPQRRARQRRLWLRPAVLHPRARPDVGRTLRRRKKPSLAPRSGVGALARTIASRSLMPKAARIIPIAVAGKPSSAASGPLEFRNPTATRALRPYPVVRAEMPVLRFQLAPGAQRDSRSRLRQRVDRRPRIVAAARLGTQGVEHLFRRRHAQLAVRRFARHAVERDAHAAAAHPPTPRSRSKPIRERSKVPSSRPFARLA